VAEATGAMEWAFAAEVEVAVGWGWIACMIDRTETLASILVGKECELPARALLVLLFLYQCTVFLLSPAEMLPAFW
jgi:hypothetical protein